MEENGAALVAVHGRTKEQGYTGEADWDAIARLKQAGEHSGDRQWGCENGR
ncbi:MAG: tRNA-dihydrouridine synthase [Chloroflexi bacterium]|nr:tRNA-dihydrouridine synthase [Chloroflexota bacterium]